MEIILIRYCYSRWGIMAPCILTDYVFVIRANTLTDTCQWENTMSRRKGKNSEL